ncbi:hypothetical protein BGZ97_011042 [Linnemannia gamsii]|uniref:Uncharacterized protein n=1 Tax=Linnemannia gamsii TaxID=64522 RepID=A0A9P6RL71_9FUNG|nr:hypothetical protein BGZ97_011042 [Linnemannia gamsii]
MTQLWNSCPKLKTCTGGNHAMWAGNVDLSPAWTCLSIERLDCAIHGIPRLHQRQHRVLEVMKTQGRTNPQTEEEQSAMQILYASLLLQEHVYQHLAQLTELKQLVVDTKMPLSIHNLDQRQKQNQGQLVQYEWEQLQYWTHRYPNQPPLHSNTMEMTYGSGLTELATLAKLTKLSVKGLFILNVTKCSSLERLLQALELG